MARTTRIPNWIATEELEEAEIVAPEVAEVPSETVEAQLVEVDGLDRQIENLIDDGQDLQDDTENLTELADTVEASEETGGLDETAAEIAEVATEAFCAKWGIKRATIAKEGFADSTTRLQATRVALEAINGAKGGLFARFVQLIQAIMDKVKDFYHAFHNAGKSTIKRAGKLKEQLNAAKGKTAPKEGELSGDWAKFCVINGKVDVAAIRKMAGGSTSIFANAAKGVEGVVGALEAKLKETERTIPDLKITDENDGAGALANQGSGDTSALTEKYKGKEAVGVIDAAALFAEATKNPVISTAEPSLIQEVGKGLRETTAMCGAGNVALISGKTDKGMPMVVFGEGKMPADVKVPALNASECSKAITELETLGRTMEDHIKAFRSYENIMRALKGTVSNIGKALDNAPANKRRDHDEALAVAKQVVLNAETSRRAFTKMMQNNATGLWSLIGASISNLA